MNSIMMLILRLRDCCIKVVFLMSIFLSLILTSLASGQTLSNDVKLTNAEDSPLKIRAILKSHCNNCHGEKKPAGMARLDNLNFDFSVAADMWFAIKEQIEQELMPPENSRKLSKGDSNLILNWIDKQFLNFMPTKPNQGNLVPHALLFGKEFAPSKMQADRVWRLSPGAYKGLINDITRKKLEGIVQPFTLTPERGIKDFAALYTIDEPSTEILIRNAEMIVESQTAHEFKDGKISGKNDSLRDFVLLMDPKLDVTNAQVQAVLQQQFKLAIGRDANAEEVSDFLKLYEKCAKLGERSAAIKTMLQAVLLRTDALYRSEKGRVEKDAMDRQQLSQLDLARAISLTLGDRKDTALFQAAQKGELTTKARVQIHLERMLDDPKFEKTRILKFFQEFFEYHNATEIFKDKPKDFMHQARTLVDDTDRLVLHILKADRDVFRELLTTQLSFVNTAKKMNKQTRQEEIVRAVIPPTVNENKMPRQIAPSGVESVYGLKEWPTVQPTVLPENTRIGILMQPSWLVAFSTNFDNDPVRRGRWVRERLLGGTVPDLPIGVIAQVSDEKNLVFRDRLKVTREKSCWNCHSKMDELGLPFENFDHFGRFRISETVLDLEATSKNIDKKGMPIGPIHHEVDLNTKGLISFSGEATLNGPVNNPREMIQRLAKSDRVRQVFIRHAFRFFMGRNETLADAKALQDADNAYVKSQGSFKALLVSLLTSDSFLYRNNSNSIPKSVGETK